MARTVSTLKENAEGVLSTQVRRRRLHRESSPTLSIHIPRRVTGVLAECGSSFAVPPGQPACPVLEERTTPTFRTRRRYEPAAVFEVGKTSADHA